LFGFVSLLSIFWGILGALQQERIKRFIAYSSVSHLGFIFLGFSLGTFNGIEASVFYFFSYLFLSLVFFFIILHVTIVKNGVEKELIYFSDFLTLVKTQKFYSFLLVLIFFSLAGIPPFYGFFSKLFIFYSFMTEGLYLLCFFVILLSAFGVFLYIRVVRLLFFDVRMVEEDLFLLTDNFFSFFFQNILIFFNIFFVLFLPFFLKFVSIFSFFLVS